MGDSKTIEREYQSRLDAMPLSRGKLKLSAPNSR